jgi:hypothetical protein
VSDELKLAVCTDLDSDLVGIAKLLGLPALAPTSTSLTNPVEVEFSDAPDENSASAYMETQYFGSPYDAEPCKVIIYPSGYDGEVPVGDGVSSRLHVLLSHEALLPEHGHLVPTGRRQ